MPDKLEFLHAGGEIDPRQIACPRAGEYAAIAHRRRACGGILQ